MYLFHNYTSLGAVLPSMFVKGISIIVCGMKSYFQSNNVRKLCKVKTVKLNCINTVYFDDKPDFNFNP